MKQFHSPADGAPIQADQNPLPGNSWEYGFRRVQGRNTGKWKHLNASEFELFQISDEHGADVAGGTGSGPDRNRWWIPFPPPAGQACAGQIVYSESEVTYGAERYLADTLHLVSDDAGMRGIVTLLWRAPIDGVFDISIKLEHRLDGGQEGAVRDPFYHILMNELLINEGRLKNFEDKVDFHYAGIRLKKGQAVEVCASTAGIVFPLTIMATDVTVEQVAEASAAARNPRQLQADIMEELGIGPVSFEGHPYQQSMEQAHEWFEENLSEDAVDLPYHFFYDGRRAADAMKTWDVASSTGQRDTQRTQTTMTYSDAKTGLELRSVIIRYNDFPVLEWTLYFKNNGDQETPIIDHIEPLRYSFRSNTGKFLLHHSAGSYQGAGCYAPFATPLPPAFTKRITAYGGRPSNSDMPYFNLECDGGNQGWIVAVGWPGQWRAHFLRNADNVCELRCGQELIHLKLHPGEEIRTPLIALQFWNGDDWIGAQNVWRRWMVKHNLPKPGGQPVKPIFSGQTGYFMDWMYKATEENQIQFIDRFLELGIDIDHWWMDTGWYDLTWRPVKERFPNGIRPISEHALSKEIKTILWFEVERVTPASPLLKEHPEWTLQATTTDQRLLNLGHPEARKWIIDRVNEEIQTGKIGVFRSDFNMDPLDHWRQNDAVDRVGITENFFVQGYLTFWDELLKRNPGLLIDSCASGGRRNDLETLRRSVPLWKSDHAVDPEAMQCQVYGLSLWLPYYGNCGGQIDKYVFRSNMNPAVTKGAWEDRSPSRDVRQDDHDYELLRQLIAQWREVSPNYLNDYYPLTPYTLQRENSWIAWQFNSPDDGSGVIHAFRRKGDKTPNVMRLKLRGLDPAARYTLQDFDEDKMIKRTGRQLMNTGLQVAIDHPPHAIVIAYNKK